MPLSEKARIEVYLPDLRLPEYQDLLSTMEQEFTYSFGGCTTIRGLEGSYLSRIGPIMQDRINLVYTDTPFSPDVQFELVARYAEKLRVAAFEA